MFRVIIKGKQQKNWITEKLKHTHTHTHTHNLKITLGSISNVPKAAI